MAEAEVVDVVILGGGINGCGTFRDLALQGVSVLLLEQGDLCQGASAASSRLMHGGLKYLETGEVRLVRESLRERNMLLVTAPHYVQALACVVPVRSVMGGMTRAVARFFGAKVPLPDRGFFITAVGLMVYDLLGRASRRTPRHRMLRQTALRKVMPALAPDWIGAGIYHEAQITHAERLALELVLDGEAAQPNARAETYISGLSAEGGILHWKGAGGEVRSIRPRVVINAGGAWIDRINALIGLRTALIGGSRGSHLVVDNPRLLQALDGRMVYFGTADGRINLAYPFQGRVLVGATDIAEADPDWATCSASEEAYLCAAIAAVFPGCQILPEQIVYRFCGVRPLPRFDCVPGSASRDHRIASLSMPDSSVPVYCLIGGKWTTFRAFAEEATNRALADLSLRRRISTAGLPIGGGCGFPFDAQSRAVLVGRLARLGRISHARADQLLARYGTRAESYVASLGPHGETPMVSLPDFACEEIRQIAATEKVTSINDILRRRTLIALSGRETPQVHAEIAEILAITGASGSTPAQPA